MRLGRLVALGTAIALLGMVATSSPQSASAQQARACVTGGAVADAANAGLISDCEALLEARGALAGNASLNWSENTPIVRWDGITLRGTPARVAWLNIRGGGLDGSVPSALGRLSNLTYLNLRSNDLSGEIPTELGDLTNLTYLNLHSNRLSGPIPGSLGNLTRLRELWLHANYRKDDPTTGLSGSIPESLGDLSNLEKVKLRNNRLSGPIPASLGRLDKLEWLVVHNNLLSGPIPPELGDMDSLEILWLGGNELTGSIPPELGGLSTLTQLHLRTNQLTGHIPAELKGLTSLRRLWIHQNQLTGSIPEELGDLANLEILSLRSNQLSGPIPGRLRELSKLKDLLLHDNRLTGSIPTELGSLESLRRLWLSQNELTGSLPASLGSLPVLTQLNLHTNMLSGTIPSELGDLADTLTRLRLGGGNQFTGCVPAALEDVEDNDLPSLGLQVCEETTEPPSTVDPAPVSMTAMAGEAAVVTHESGARIEIPAGATNPLPAEGAEWTAGPELMGAPDRPSTEMVTVSIEALETPSSSAVDIEAYDFSVVDEDGEDVELRGPVTVTLPYTMPEGKDATDLMVVHWNERLERWESVEGGVMDEADHTVTVEMDHLSVIGTSSFVNALTFLAMNAQSLIEEAESFIYDRIGQSYDAGYKHTVTLSGEVTVPVKIIGVNLGGSLTLDADDILSLTEETPTITEEGASGFFTYGLDGHFALKPPEKKASFTIQFTVPFTGFDLREGYHRDLNFDSEVSLLSVSLPGGYLETKLLTYNEKGNFDWTDAEINKCPLCGLTFNLGGHGPPVLPAGLEPDASLLPITLNLAKGEFNTNFSELALDLSEGRCRDGKCEMTWSKFIGLYLDHMVGGPLKVVHSLGEEIGLLYEYTDFEHVGPKDAANIGWGYVNQVEDVTGGHDVNGDGRGDLVFPADRTDGIPLKLWTTGDNLEQKRHFLEVYSITDGWNIELDEASWYAGQNAEEEDPSDDALLRVDYDVSALSFNQTHWLVTADEDAPASGQISFRLGDNRKFFFFGQPDEQLDDATITLWKDKQLSDLSIEAAVDPDPVITDGPVTYTVTVENRGPDTADDVKLMMKRILSLGFHLEQASLGASSLSCDDDADVGNLSCNLGDIDAGETAVVTLRFRMKPTYPTETPVSATFAVMSDESGGALPKAELTPEDNTADVTAMTKSDREALTALYNATDGPNWSRSDNWVTAAPLDDWRGVETDDRGRVTSLHLVEQGLNGQMPPELGDLTELRWLSLARNRDLTGDIPPELAALTKLEVLYLWENDLTGPVPTWLGDLTKLERVSLGHNRLTGAMPNDLSKLTRVETLYLAGNGLSGEIPDWVGDLTGMTRLFLYDNDLEGDVPSTLGNLENLEYLHLRGNDDLMGCLPSSLKDVVDNDFDRVGLDFCAGDRDALVALYNATGGDNWNDDTNWLSSAPIGEWYGVTTDSDGRVTSLKAVGKQPVGPAAVGAG